MERNDLSLSIIVPAYNEESNIEHTINEILQAAESFSFPFEILVVNDASTDSTGKIAEESKKKDSRIHIIHNSINQGFGGAYRTGIVNAKFDYCLMVPGDNAYPAHVLKRLMEKHGQADLVISYTTNVYVRKWTRRMLSSLFVAIMNFLFQLRLRYYNGISIIPTRYLRKVQVSNGFSYAAENLVRFLKIYKCSVVEVPAEISERKGRRSGAITWRNIWILFTGTLVLIRDVYLSPEAKPSKLTSKG